MGESRHRYRWDVVKDQGPDDQVPDESDQLDAEELDLVAGGFHLHAMPTEDEPFSPGTY